MVILGTVVIVATLAFASAGLAAPPTVSDLGPPAAAPGAAEPFVSATRHGVLMSWLEPAVKANEMALRFSVHEAGRWSQPRTVVQRADLFVNWADFPSVVKDAKGMLFAHWPQRCGSATYAYDVWIATSRDGGRTWSGPLILNRDGRKDEHGFVPLAPLPNGGVGAAWLNGAT
jgi:hypothetical protein